MSKVAYTQVINFDLEGITRDNFFEGATGSGKKIVKPTEPVNSISGPSE